jgi:HK97 family phage portal protein
MGFIDRLLGREPDITTLDLKRVGPIELGDASRVGMPKPPPLDVSLDNLWRYAKRSEVVFACIEKKATAATDAVLVIEKKSGDEWEPVDSHPMLSLLNKPNPYDDGESFIKSWIESENFADNFYAEIVRSGAGVPVQLFPLNPIYLVPQWYMGSNGWYIDHYRYFQTGYPVRLEVEDILVRRRHSLGSIYSDVSQMAVALNSIDADTSATEYVRAFWNNGGAPSGVIAIAGRTLTPIEVKHIQQEWMSRYSRNGSNRLGPAILPEGTTYTPVSSKLNELNNESLSDEAVSKICMIFGVPPILIGAVVGLKHVTQNATAQAAMGEFWAHTMSPELKSIRNFLTWTLLPMFEDINTIKNGLIRCNWDLSQVDAMQEDVDAVHSRVGEGYQNGIYTLNEARAKVGLDPVDANQGGDEFFKPPQPVAPDNQPPDKPKPPKVEWEDLPDLRKLVYDQANGNGSKKNFEYQGMTLSREPSAIEQTVDIKAIYDSYETGKDALAKVIQTMRTDLIKQATKEVKSFGDGDIHTLTLVPPSYAQKSVTREIRNAVDDGRSQVAMDADKSDKAIIVIETKSTIDELIRTLVEITISRVVNEISSAAINIYTMLRTLGLDEREVESRIDTELRERSDAPFDGIARQSVNAAVNAGRREEMKDRDDEIEYYYWSAILDKNVCGPCEELDGATADRLDQLPDAPYENCEGGSSCRCFVIAVFAGEGDGNNILG